MRRVRIIAAAVTVAALAMPASAFASPPGVISVSGHQEVDLGGDCPDIGAVATFVMTDGDLEGCWYTDSFNVVAAGPSGMIVGSGTEHFVGDIGSWSGTLFLKFNFVGKFDAGGAELWGGCRHPIRGGTEDFDGANGVVVFTDLPDGSGLPPADYTGQIVLR